MKIKWDDYVSNAEVLSRAGIDSIEATMASIQLRSEWRMAAYPNNYCMGS